MTKDADYWIQQLNMIPHPEGGYYKESYRSSGTIDNPFETNNEGTPTRNYSTGIYFLLRPKESRFYHRIKSDEMWHYYSGSPLLIYEINPINCNYKTTDLGIDLEKGQIPQYVVPAGFWFGSKPIHDQQYSLVGCTMAPGFHVDDFELAKKDTFHQLFPQHNELINQLK